MPGQTLPNSAIMTGMKTVIDAASLGVTTFKTAVPPATDFPYIVIDEVGGALISDKDTWGNSQIYTVHVWSKARDRVQVQTLMSGTLEALTDGSMVVVGFNFIQILLDSDNVIRDPEESAFHGILSMRVETYGNNRP